MQITSWALTNNIRSSEMIGHGLDNAMIESLWVSMQIELLNRKKWRTLLELHAVTG